MIEILQGYDRAPIVTLETDDASALESKLSAAARLFTDRKSWQKPFERIAILHRLSVLLEGKREHFGLQIAREGGKPLTDALIEVDRAIDGVRNAARHAARGCGSGDSDGLDSRQRGSPSLYDSRADPCPSEQPGQVTPCGPSGRRELGDPIDWEVSQARQDRAKIVANRHLKRKCCKFVVEPKICVDNR